MALHEETREQLIEDCWQRHYKALCRVAYRYVRNEQDAQDIVQESAYKAVKCSQTLREPSHVTAWLYQIVRNESVSFLRKNKQVCVPLWELDGEQDLHCADIDLTYAIGQLNVGEKKVILLRFFGGLSFSQIAEALQENINTIKSRLYRALEKLKFLLEDPYSTMREGGCVYDSN